MRSRSAVRGKAGLGWPAISELVDTGLDKPELQHIRRVSVDGVREPHLLRTRLVDVHIIVGIGGAAGAATYLIGKALGVTLA